MFVRFRCVILFTVVLAAALIDSGSAATTVEFERHDLKIVLDVPAQEATIADQGLVRVQAGWNLFYLNGGAGIDSLAVADNLVEFFAVKIADTAQLPPAVRESLPELETDGDPLLVFFESARSGTVPFALSYRALFQDPVENVRFSRENVGREVTGTILERGAYLSSTAYFYPVGEESLSIFRLTADIPLDWRCVSDGNLVSSEAVAGRRVESWENPYANDGCMFMAAPYVVRSVVNDGVEVACYFFEADTALIDGYLEATTGYLTMYSDLIGPYPFERFTVAENFFPTGYGMPAWTLLGQQVLRLPFIKRTSLGHEVLHNWWGNSVYVDYDRGNWCEGATVYGADYRYKLMESPQAARDYRKDILKQYISYINEGNDFPVRDFRSRTSPGSRTIGYNKAMMVFHMLEEEIGEEPFRQAGKLVFSKYKGQKISWEEWIDAFGETSGQDLSWVISQWIDRTGAPVLAVEVIECIAADDNQRQTVRLALSQTGSELYRLRVPLHFDGEETAIDTFVVLDAARAEHEFEISGRARSVEVDPDYHLFRRLYPEEIEPIVSAVLGIEPKRIVSYSSDEALNRAFQLFGVNLCEDSAVVEGELILNSATKGFAPVLLNPPGLPGLPADWIIHTDSSLVVNATEYPKEGHTFVLAGGDWMGFDRFMVVLTDDAESLPRLGQLVPHYGKYSYLVFQGARNIGKGQWVTGQSPLKKTLAD